MRAFGVGTMVWLAGGVAGATPTLPGGLTNKLQATSECIKCHSFKNPDEIADQPFVTPVAWQGGMMANSARDPVFWAGVAVASQDGDTTTCVRCHVPRAFVGGNEGVQTIDELSEDELTGVDCDLCHRLVDDGETPPGNALYAIDDVLGMNGEIAKRGPWDYTEGLVPMHAWLQDPYMGASRACGTCHDVETEQDRVDSAGMSLGEKFGEQRTYSEWVNSAYAAAGEDFKSCQDCHMPAVDDVAGCLEFNAQGDRHPTGGRRHDLGGANRRMVELLKGVYGDAGEGTIGDAFFDIAIASIDRTLAEAATLTVEAPTSVDLAAGISGLAVTVTNKTGHKLPSGYSEGRVMWLEVVGRYADEVVYSSGRWLAGEGLEGDPQQRTYEAVAVEYGTDTRFHLLRNNTWVVDSRIPPLGLKQDGKTDPVGDRYTLLPDQTWPNFDEVVYEFSAAEVVDATPDEDDVMELSVRLLYVVNTPEYIEFLADTAGAPGQTVADLFAGLGAVEPLVLAEWSQTVPLTGLMEPTPGSTSSGTGSESSGSAGSEGGTAVVPTSGGVPMSGGESGAEGSGGNAEGEGGEGGCGCRSTPGGEAWWLGLGLLGLRRRRR